MIEAPLRSMVANFVEHQQPLTEAEQSELLATMRSTEPRSAEWTEARNRLVAGFYRYAVRIGRRSAGPALPIDDAIQCANMGLMHAATKYEPSHNTKFITYASYWMIQACQKARENGYGPMRVPIHNHQWIHKVQRSLVQLQHELNRAPTDEEVADRCGLNDWEVRLLRRATSDFRLEFQLPNGGDFKNLLSNGQRTPLDEVATADEMDPRNRKVSKLWRVMARMASEREMDILASRLGIWREHETLEVVAQRYGITKERVRQLEAETLIKLCRAMVAVGFEKRPSHVEALKRIAHHKDAKLLKQAAQLVKQIEEEQASVV